MEPFLFRQTMAMILLMSGLAFNGVSSSRNNSQAVNSEHTEEYCPPCELLFSKLEINDRSGKLAQDVRVQERGEPKSGTGITYSWTTATLTRTCDYLQGLFGEESCRAAFNKEERVDDGLFSRYSNESMVFDPSLGNRDARCSCDTVGRVSITTSEANKHRLPVNSGCAFSHVGDIGFGRHEGRGNARPQPCTFADGTPVNNHDDLWRCMHEANCAVTDDWIQMAVFRDPRPAIVSTFYHVEVHTIRGRGDLEAFVIRELPIMCQWLAVRYILFTGILADQSIEFWYADTIGDPLGWHYHWLNSVGLQLPFHVVEAMAQAAAADDLGFTHKKIDRHPGEEARTEPGVRQFEDEVSPELRTIADDVLRTWLPPVLLERFGVVP